MNESLTATALKIIMHASLCAQPIMTMYCLMKRKRRTSKRSRVDKQNSNNF